MNQRLILIVTLIVLTVIALLTQRHTAHSATSAVPLQSAPHTGNPDRDFVTKSRSIGGERSLS
jgi:hypothetical protein